MRGRARHFLLILQMVAATWALTFSAPRPIDANSGCSLVVDAAPSFAAEGEPSCELSPGESCYQCIYSSPETSGYQFCAETPDAGVRLCSYAPDIQQVPF